MGLRRSMRLTNNLNNFDIRPEVWVCLFLVLSTLLIYFQVGTFDFVNYDTGEYVYENNLVKSGLTAEGIKWVFTTIHYSNWHPVTWLSHMLDVQLYGLHPGRHHLTNVLLHIVNTLLLFGVLRRMTGKLWQSSFVAALFALHPLHVESVAWIAERKDLLSACFGFLTLWFYARFVQNPGISRYVPVLLFFMLSLMAKPMMVTLPFVLLLLDYWPLVRSQFQVIGDKSDHPGSQTAVIVSLILAKIPLFLVSAASCIITLYAQQAGGSVGSFEFFPFHLRLVNALVSYANYMCKMVWPVNLAVIYPYPRVFPAWQIWASCLVVTGMSYLALVNYKSRPWLPVGWFWFLGTLIPVIGLVQVGSQALADRYTYVPITGLFIILSWGLFEILARWPLQKFKFAVIAVMVAGTLMAVSWKQIGCWKNSVTLFNRAVDVTKNNFIAQNNLGHALLMRDEITEAADHFKKSSEINPGFAAAHLNLALVLERQGKLEQAIKHYVKALQIKPNNTDAHNNLGNIWYRLGRTDKAYAHYLAAIKINPAYADAYNNLGTVSIRMGDPKRAVIFFERALKINPESESAQNNLNKALSALEMINDNSAASK